MWLRQESNLNLRLRKPLYYPLYYAAITPKGLQISAYKPIKTNVYFLPAVSAVFALVSLGGNDLSISPVTGARCI